MKTFTQMPGFQSLSFLKEYVLLAVLPLWISVGSSAFSQTNTTTAGLWNTSTNWSAGVPTGSSTATVNNAMTLNTNISVSGGYYTINQPVTDLAGGTAYTLSITGSSSNGTFDVYANTTFEGPVTVNAHGVLIVRNGATLTVGAGSVFANNSTVLVEAGGTLIVNGDLTNNNNSTGITINGTLIVNGNFNGGNGSAITGTGSMSTTGSLTTSGSGSVFGSTGDCNTGPCSGNNLCATNNISSSQTTCEGANPSVLTGNALSGYTYQWQNSTTSSTSGFSNISGATGQNYTPGALLTTTWYRRVVTNGSSCTATSTAVQITVNANSWLGGTSTNWGTASNWCGGVPTASTDVLISSGTTYSPVISGTANAKSITINSAATLTKSNTATLNIYGDFTNNGTFTDNGIYTDAGAVVFTGTTAQNINSATTFNNLIISNSNGVTLNAAVNVNGILTLSSGTLTTNGNLSQNLYNGAIAGSGSGSISGNVTFFKTIWGDKYHYMSAPTSGLTFAQWNDNVTIKSNNLYSYDETVADTSRLVGWNAVTSTSATIGAMQGYAFYFPKYIYNTKVDVTGTYSHLASYSSTLTNTVSGNSDADGWNLVGNPYPSTIDWDATSGWTKTNITNAYYTWDARTNRYVSYVNGVGSNGGSRYIGSMQGFFVKVTNPGSGTLGMNNNIRVTSTLIDTWRTSSENARNIFRISAQSGDYSDETVIRFSNMATPEFDGNLDAYKLLNGGMSPSLYTVSENTEYSINSLPDTLNESIIPLQIVTGFSGIYTLTADVSQFQSNQTITLEDRELGVSQDLTSNNVYSVYLNQGSYNNRFYLNYQNQRTSVVTGVQADQSNEALQIGSYQQNIIISNFSDISNMDVNVYNTSGQLVYEMKNVAVNADSITIPMSVPAAVYIVKVNTTQGTLSKQVMLSK